MRNASLGTVVLLAVTAGCAVTQPQNTPAWQKQETDPVTGAAYWMYVPAAYRDDKPAPLVVTCHGTPPFDVSEHHVRELKMLGEQNGRYVTLGDAGPALPEDVAYFDARPESTTFSGACGPARLMACRPSCGASPTCWSMKGGSTTRRATTSAWQSCAWTSRSPCAREK